MSSIARTLSVAVVTLLVLAACSGGGGGGGSSGGDATDSVNGATALGPNGEAITVVNATSQGGLGFMVDPGPEMKSGQTLRVTLTDRNDVVRTFTVSVPDLIDGPFYIGPFDVSGLSDGTLTVMLVPYAKEGPLGDPYRLTLSKDTVPPAAPLAFEVPANTLPPLPVEPPVGVVNLENVADVHAYVEFEEVTEPGEWVQITFLAPEEQIQDEPFDVEAAQGGLLRTGFDLSSFPDGDLKAQLVVWDPAGNSTVVLRDLRKDTWLDMPTAAMVAAGPTNAAHFVNASSQNTAVVSVSLSNPDPDQLYQVEVSDGSAVAMTPWVALRPPAETIEFAEFDLSGLAEGPLSLTARVVDMSGNLQSQPGTPAIKDTLIGTPLTATVLGSAGNPVGVVNGASVGITMVEVALDGQVQAGDTLTLTITDTGSQSLILTASTSQGPGPFAMGPIDATGLADGALTLGVTFDDVAGNHASGIAGSALKDATPPPAPTFLGVAAGAGNLAHNINPTNIAATFLDVQWAPSVEAGVVAALTLTSSGGGQVVVPSFTVPQGGTAGSIGPINCTSLTDGIVTLSMVLTDPYTNTTAFSGIPASLNTSGPPTPIAAAVASGPSNPASVINDSNVGAVLVTVGFGANSLSTHDVSVILSDGATTITTPSQSAPAGAGTLNFAGIDCSSLGNGTVGLTVVTYDTVSALSSSFGGTPAVKATSTLNPPLAAVVAATALNPQSFINTASQGNVTVQVTLPASYTGTESIQVSINDGAHPLVISLPQTAPSGGGTLTFPNLVATGLNDGTLALVVNATDQFSNSAAYNGTPAVKDTTAPALPSALAIASSPNNGANQISIASITAALLGVGWPATLVGDETFTLTFTTSGAPPVTVGPFSAPAGGAGSNLGPYDLTGLVDGPVTLGLTLTDPAGNPSLFTGTPGIVDITPPTAPVDAAVAATPGNATSVINLSNVGTTDVVVAFGPTSDAADLVTIELLGGGVNVSALPLSAPAGAGELRFAGLNTSTIPDGSVTLTVMVTDPFGNTTSFAGQVALKDVSAPGAPTQAQVAASSLNPADVINIASVTAARVDCVLPGTYTGGEVVRIELADASGRALSWQLTAAPGGGTLSFLPLDTTALEDGTLGLTINIRDAAGNTTVATGIPPIKDTVVPLVPTGNLIVAAGGQNPPNVVNENSVSGAFLEIPWDPATVGDESVLLTIADSLGGIVSFGPFTAPAGGAPTLVGPVSLVTLADGPLNLDLRITDPAGNRSTAVGAALLDVVDPSAPTSAGVIAGPSNPIHVINLNNQGAAVVDVFFASGAETTDTVTVTLTDSTIPPFTATTPSQPAPDGSGILGFTFDASSLAEGSVQIQVEVVDANLNSLSFLGTTATKDTVYPGILGAHVAADVAYGNPIDFINAASAADVTVQVDLPPATYTGVEQIQVRLIDGAAPSAFVSSSWLTVPAGATQMLFTGLSCGALLDGSVSLNVFLIDGVQNNPGFGFTPATKDVVAPPALGATADLAIAANTPSNPANVINVASVGGVQLSVLWPAGIAGDETAQVVVTSNQSGGPGSATFTLGVPAGFTPGAAILGPSDTTALADGDLTLGMTITDPAGNATTSPGTSGLKDATPAATPQVASIPLVTGVNPANAINAANEGAVGINVLFDPTSTTANLVRIILQDAGMTTATAGPPIAAPMGAGPVSYVINATGLAQGPVSLIVEITDPNLNVTTFTGTPAVKDLTAPSAPTAVTIAAGTSNPLGWINLTSQGSVSVAMTLPGDYIGGELVTVTLDDGTTVTTPVQGTATGAGTLTIGGIDATLLSDGFINISVSVVDLGGNPGGPFNFAGAAQKDVLAPDAATALAIKANTPNNLANFINGPSAATVELNVTWGLLALVTDTAEVLVTSDQSGGSGAASITVPVAAGFAPGAGTIGAFDASAVADGVLTLTLTTYDQARNGTPMTGTPGQKDTTGPTAPSAASVVVTPMAGNAQNVINIASAATVTVSVTFDSGNSPTNDTFVVILEDTGSGSVDTGAPQPVPATFSGTYVLDASALADGGVTVAVVLYDQYTNKTTHLGTAATKDTVAPVGPVSAGVPAGTDNPVDTINLLTMAAAAIDVVLPIHSSYDGSETVQVTLVDTATTAITGGPTPGSAGGTVSFTGLDTTSLIDGTLVLTVEVLDAAGNGGSHAGTNPVRDTAPPDLTAVQVDFTPASATDFINPANQASVSVRTDWGAAALATDAVDVVFDDGSNPTVSTGSTAYGLAGAGTLLLGPLDLSGLADGTVGMEATATDPAWNTTIVQVTVIKLATLDQDRYAYVTNEADDTLSAYVIDGTGKLHSRGYALTGDEPVAAAVSSTTEFAYVCNRAVGTVSAYGIAPGTGDLTFLGTQVAGTNPVAIVLDPLDRFAYVVNYGNGTMSVFAINPNGTLATATTYPTPPQPTGIAIDALGRNCWVVGTPSVITHFALDPTTGTAVAGMALPTSPWPPSQVAVHPSGQYLYVVNSMGFEISTFAIAADGSLSAGPLGAFFDPRRITFHPSGLLAYTVNAPGNAVEAFTVNMGTGALMPMGLTPTGTDPVDCHVSADGNTLFVLMRGDDRVWTYSLGGGPPTFVGLVPTMDQPSAMAFGRGTDPVTFVLRHAYVVNQQSSTISVHAVNDINGSLGASLQSIATGADPFAIALHPGNGFLYTANSTGDSLSMYSIAGLSGILSPVGSGSVSTAPGINPQEVVIDPTGRFVFSTQFQTHDVSTWGVNPATGALSLVSGSPVSLGSGANPTKMVVHPTGKYAYVIKPGAWQVEALDVNLITGALSSVTTGANPQVVGGPTGLDIHPAGTHLYVSTQGGIETYPIDPIDGSLWASLGTTTAGFLPYDITVEPSGSYAYVVNKVSKNVSMFAIQPTGALIAVPGPLPSAGNDPVAIATEPRSEFVYVVDAGSGGNGEVRVYAIDPMTGFLTQTSNQTVIGLGSNGLSVLIDLQ